MSDLLEGGQNGEGYKMVSLEIIKDNFFEAFNILERYMPGIMAIVYAGKDADTAINNLLGTVNPTNN